MNTAENKIYDLAIIGAGIAGAAVARDAALRGFKTAVIEKSLPGSGTSSKSSKLIHGGIRYLEVASKRLAAGDLAEAWQNLRFVFASLREARRLERIAPDLVRPLQLCIPIYEKTGRKPWVVYTGCWLYALLAALCGDWKPPRILRSAQAALEVLPPLQPRGLLGAVLIWDRWTDDRKLVEATLGSAERHGAETFTGTEVVSWRFDEAEKAFCVETSGAGGTRQFRARNLVNAAGPWADRVRERGGEKGPAMIEPVGGAHITVKNFLPVSALLEAEDGRVFFAIRLGEHTRVGTTERAGADPENTAASQSEIAYLLRSLNAYFGGMNFKESDILASDAGVRPLVRPEKRRSENQISREHAIRRGASGIWHVLGVKLTDHRRVAEEAVDRIVKEGNIRPELRLKSRTRGLRLEA